MKRSRGKSIPKKYMITIIKETEKTIMWILTLIRNRKSKILTSITSSNVKREPPLRKLKYYQIKVGLSLD